MSDIIKFMELDWKNGLLFVAAIIIVAVFILQKTDWIVERLGLTSKRKLAEMKQTNDINELKTHAKKTDENIDKILDGMEVLQKSVHDLSDQMGDLQSKSAENEAARIKDRVAQAYRYYHNAGRITKMEKEALEENIKAYSQYSSNSFIHSVVEKELPMWEIIDE